ncbi:hypothetical protein [Vibrio phage vB_pir03]|nr:hypothetical protein [Vibrio phage vB_pir03]
MIRPEINATGQWVLEQPFTADPSIVYSCQAINGFEALELAGVDVYLRYYSPLGIDEAKFREDKLNKVDIVTLIAEGKDPILVPTSYILQAPGVDAVEYNQYYLAIQLGMLPGNTSFVSLVERLKDVVKSDIGITPLIRQVAHPVTNTVTNAEHEQIEAMRATLREVTPSSEQKVIEQQKIIAAQATRIILFQEEIIRLRDLLG